MRLQGVSDAVEIFSRSSERFCFTQASSENDRVVIGFQLFHGDVEADFYAVAEVDSKRADEFYFAVAVGGAELVLGDSERVESAAAWSLVEDRYSDAVSAQLGRTREGSGSGANAGYFEMSFVGWNWAGWALGIKVLHRVALQAADFDGAAAVRMQHARAFAKHVYWTNAGAAKSEDVGIKDGVGRTFQIAGGNFLDEARNVDVGGTGAGARGVVTEEAPGRLPFPPPLAM